MPAHGGAAGASAAFQLREGEEVWAVLALGEMPGAWTVDRARETLDAAVAYWHDWVHQLAYTGPRGERVRRSALAVHLLGYAPAGSLVAAPTTSLPERIGGDRNYDYRFAWVRDASLSMAILALLGDTRTARRYMDWLAGLDSSTDAPLQVAYRIGGGTDLTQRERPDLAGYRASRPVRVGNHAFSQRQLDSSATSPTARWSTPSRGAWRDEYWALIRRVADYTAANWAQPDSGIWELPGEQQHYVSSKVMAWVALERAGADRRAPGLRGGDRRLAGAGRAIHAGGAGARLERAPRRLPAALRGRHPRRGGAADPGDGLPARGRRASWRPPSGSPRP